MPCPLSSFPHDCFTRYQNSFLQTRNRHSWESIGECDGCKLARINALIAFTPEPDRPAPHQRANHIREADFTEPAPKVETRGRKERLTCPKGHNEWGWQGQGATRQRYCRACNRARVNRQRNGGIRCDVAPVTGSADCSAS